MPGQTCQSYFLYWKTFGYLENPFLASYTFFPPYPAAIAINKTTPLPIGAPPPTGVLPLPGSLPPFGGGGDWARVRLIVNSVIVNSVAADFMNVLMILLF